MRNPSALRSVPFSPVYMECADCRESRRCWDTEVPRQAGFSVRCEPLHGRGEILFAQGDPFVAAYLVSSGCLKLSETRLDGTERIIGFRVAGEIIGLEGLLQGTYPCRAEVIEPALVCRLSWTRRQGEVPHASLLQRLLMKTMSQCQATERPWSGLPAQEQVRLFLEDFGHRTHRDSLALPMTRAEIGSYLGIAEETVVRAIARLRAGSARSHPLPATADGVDQE